MVGASAGSGRTVPRSRPAPPGSQARLRARARAWRGAPRRQAVAPAGPWEGAVTWRRLSLAVAGEQLGTGSQDKPGPGLGGAAAQAALPAKARRPLSPPHSSAFLCGARGPPACCAGLWADGGRRGRQGASGGGPGRGGRPPPRPRPGPLCLLVAAVTSTVTGGLRPPRPSPPSRISLCVPVSCEDTGHVALEPNPMTSRGPTPSAMALFPCHGSFAGTGS